MNMSFPQTSRRRRQESLISHAFGRLAFGALLLVKAAAADVARLDADGYIRDWVMLAPIALPEGADAGDLLLRRQIPDESSLKPKAGDTVTVNGRQLTWQNITAPTNFFDFNAVLKTQNDQSAGFMVTYVECDREIPDVIMAVGSNDQGRIYFNGVDIYAVTEARQLVLDGDKGRVTLKAGVNVIVFKIINVSNSWQGAMRLTDRAGQPLKDVRIRREAAP
jgi:hypothetical protein